MSEQYTGIKFKTIFRKTQAPVDDRIKELKKWCKFFHEKNLAPPYPGGSYGNLSFRTENNKNEFIITGTCIGFKNNLSDDCFVKIISCDIINKVIYAEGTRNPSSESMLHYAIYKKRPDVNAIFHGHSKEVLASATKLNIPETLKEKPYGSIELVNSVIEILNNHHLICMKNHGFISLGETMEEAGKRSIKIISC